MAIKAAKRNYFSALIVSAGNRPAALFGVSRSLLHQRVRDTPLQGRAEEFGCYLHDKIAQIREGLASDWISPEGPTEAGLESTFWEEFDPVAPEDMDRMLGRLNTTMFIGPVSLVAGTGLPRGYTRLAPGNRQRFFG